MTMRHPAGPALGVLLIPVAVLVVGCAHGHGATEVQRVVDADSIGHIRGDGNAVLSMSTNDTKRVCIAPPAHAAVTVNLTSSTAASLAYDDVEASATLERSLAETLGKLYEHNEQTLFVQHVLYRLCEANANGMLKDVDARDLLIETLLALQEARRQSEKDAATARQELEAAKVANDKAERAYADERAKKPTPAEKAAHEEKVRTLQEAHAAARSAQAKALQNLEEIEQRVTSLDRDIDAVDTRIRTHSGKQGSAYGILFARVFNTATDLADADVRRQRALADRAIAEQKKAEAALKLEQAKASGSKKKLDELQALLQAAALKTITAKSSSEECKAGEVCKKE